MKRKLRGLKRRDIQLDFDLYRVEVPIRGLADVALSVIDIWPEGVEKAIMFVHGYAGCAETWEYQINHFARRYRVVAPDLRGHGQSDAPFTQYTMPELVDDINTIAETLGLPERFILAGHSFGRIPIVSPPYPFAVAISSENEVKASPVENTWQGPFLIRANNSCPVWQ